MIGKVFLFALIGVAFAQEEVLDESIRTGLNKARVLNQSGIRRIEAALREVSFKSKLIESRTSDFVDRSIRTQDGVRQALGNIARTMEEKARETRAPQSVFECITRVEENANNDVQSFTEKFQADVQRLEKTKLANIKTDTKPLDGMENALRVRYERAVAQIKQCKNEICIGIAINSFGRWLDQMYADIKRILGQVNTIYTNYQRDATTFLNNANRQITRVKGSASRNLRQCLYSREEIFVEN